MMDMRRHLILMATVSAVIAAHGDVVTNATGRTSAGRSGNPLVAQGPLWRETWKDPLSEEEIKALMEMHCRYEREKGAESRKAHEPTVSDVPLKSPISFLGRTFGQKRAVADGQRSYRDGVLECYFPRVVLEEPYFCFDNVSEYLSPSTRLYSMTMWYSDYDSETGPKGRFRDASQALDTARAIVGDLGKRLGTPLQELRLFRQLWPYHPGLKMSRMWSGSIPQSFICTEKEWLEARHGFGYSRTRAGDYSINVRISKIYYDEYSVSVTIEDAVETERARTEHSDAREKAGLPRDPNQPFRRSTSRETGAVQKMRP